MPATASTEEANQTRSAPMEFEVAHSFPESRVLASYPLPQGTYAIGNACFCKFFAPPLSRVAHPLVAASLTPRPPC